MPQSSSPRTVSLTSRPGLKRSHRIAFRRLALLLITAACALLIAACGNQNSAPPPIVVTFTPGFTPPTAMTVNEQCGVAATVTNDAKIQGVNWTVSCSNAPCGGFTPTSSSASAVPITYTAPPAAPTGGTVTLTATSVTDPNKNATSSPIPIGATSSGCTAP